MADNVIPLKKVLKDKQQEVGNTEDWLGMAPEALEELIVEIEGLKWLDSQGDMWYPLF